MKTRLKEIRKALKITQAGLADALHISKSAIEAYEYGRAEITDRTIADICRIYKINETWFRTGSGEMFAPITRKQEIAQIASTIFKDEDNMYRDKAIMFLSQLSKEEINSLAKFIIRFADYLKEDNQ